MAQNVTIAGASYTDVPSIVVPKTGGGTASFVDVSTTTAVAEDVASGKIFYLADGTQGVGTNSGGGGDTFAQICNKTITSYESTELLTIPTNTLRSNTTLTSIKAPNLENLGSYALGGFRGTVIALPGFKGNGNSDGYYFSGSTTLTTVDFGPSLVRLNANFFNGATNVNTLIIRKTTIPTMSNASAINTTKFKSGGTGGTIYIPKALYDHLGDGTSLDYKAATNWSTVNGYGTITWAKIEGSQYENYYADGTPIT